MKSTAVGKSLDSDMKITPTTLTQCGGAQRAGWTCEQTNKRTLHTIYTVYTCIHPHPYTRTLSIVIIVPFSCTPHETPSYSN